MTGPRCATAELGGMIGHVPMREECKQFESRTYADGETVRKCNLDLAPDAPWRCPANCAAFEPRLADVAWEHGSLVTPKTPEEPPGLDDGSAAAILDEAEDVVNSAVPELLAQVRLEQEEQARRDAARHKGLGRFLRRRRG